MTRKKRNRTSTNSFSNEIERVVELGEEKISNVGDKIKSYVKSNPERAIVIAIGIGAVVGSGLRDIVTRKHGRRNG